MTEEDIRFPDVNYDAENNKDAYVDLTTLPWSPFLDHTYWEVFIFCMSYAYAKKLTPLEPSGQATLNAKLFSTPVRHLMRSLAIDHYNNISVIKDSNKVVKICEQYANAGIKEVHFKFKNKPSDKPIESVFIDMQNEIAENL